MIDDTHQTAPDADLELPLPSRRRHPRFAGPSRVTEITIAAATIILALLGLIFYPDVMSLAPPLPTAAFWTLMAVFHLSAFDVAVRALRGWDLWLPALVIVCLGGGATIVAIALAYLSSTLT
jgi:hypothetical protein